MIRSLFASSSLRQPKVMSSVKIPDAPRSNRCHWFEARKRGSLYTIIHENNYQAEDYLYSLTQYTRRELQSGLSYEDAKAEISRLETEAVEKHCEQLNRSRPDQEHAAESFKASLVKKETKTRHHWSKQQNLCMN